MYYRNKCEKGDLILQPGLDATKRDPGRRNGNLTSYFTFNKITTILQVHSF